MMLIEVLRPEVRDQHGDLHEEGGAEDGEAHEHPAQRECMALEGDEVPWHHLGSWHEHRLCYRTVRISPHACLCSQPDRNGSEAAARVLSREEREQQ
jgi:hypothetical protein